MAGLMEKDYGVGWFDAPESAPSAPGYGNYLALPEKQPERMDPKRMLWAGTLMDIGNAFGNALAGTGASQGNAMRLYGHARDYNNSLDQQARERAEALRQQKIEAEDRALQRRLIESRIGKYQADASAVPRPEPIGSPQRMADGSLAQTVQMPDGTIRMEPLGQFANEGRVVTVAGVPYFLDARSNTLMDLGQGSGNPQPQSNPGQATSPQNGGTQPQGGPRFSPETVAEQEASQAAAVEQAKLDAKREAEMEANRSKQEKALAVAEQNIQRIDELMKPENWNEVGFGMLEGRLTGGTPFFGSQWDDEFDSISAVKLLENMENMGANPTDADMAVARSISLDRSRDRDYNKKELGRVREILVRNLNDLKSKLGIEVQETDDDLVNKYLD